MKLDKALEYAVIVAWEDLMKTATPCSVRIEYRSDLGTPLDYVSIWSVRARGHRYLVCDYWTWTSQAHPSGIRFRNGHHSDQLAQALDFIMKNQDQFSRPRDAFRDGLVLIDPPTEGERTEAANRMREFHGTAANFGGAAEERVPLSMMSLKDCRPAIESN